MKRHRGWWLVPVLLVVGACAGAAGPTGQATGTVTPTRAGTPWPEAPARTLVPTPTPTPRPSSPPGNVTQTEYGAEWPFTVPSGTLACYPSGKGDGRLLVTFSTGNGTEYALNGQARTFGFPELDTSIMPAWPDGSGLTDLIARGLKLCGEASDHVDPWPADFEEKFCLAVSSHSLFVEDLTAVQEAAASDDLDALSLHAYSASTDVMAIDLSLELAPYWAPAAEVVTAWRAALAVMGPALDKIDEGAVNGDEDLITEGAEGLAAGSDLLGDATGALTDFIAETSFVCS